MTIDCRLCLSGAKISPNFGDRAILGDRAGTQRNEKKRKENQETSKRKKETRKQDFQVQIALRLRPLLARICSRSLPLSARYDDAIKGLATPQNFRLSQT
jgi:hypothetical protein